MMKWVNRFIDSGIMPETGAGLDQTASFLEMVDFITLQQKIVKAELKLE